MAVQNGHFSGVLYLLTGGLCFCFRQAGNREGVVFKDIFVGKPDSAEIQRPGHLAEAVGLPGLLQFRYRIRGN